MKEKCPNPNCKGGKIGELDNGIPGSLPVACCICEGRGEVDIISKMEMGPEIFERRNDA